LPAYVALLRAVNVGGTGKLPMSDLKALCQKAGFAEVQTYIASGNVVFTSKKSAAGVKAALEDQLELYAGKRVAVHVRSAAELAEVLAANPFPNEAPNRTIAIFLDERPPRNTLETVTGRDGEKIQLGRREIYIYYGEAMASSKLKIPAAQTGTGRNMNTVAKLVELAAAL